jgi:hypothetical protein
MARARTSPATGEKKTAARAKKVNGPTVESANGNHLNGNVEDRIRTRAYELFESRGREHGAHENDWFAAEAEVRSHTA